MQDPARQVTLSTPRTRPSCDRIQRNCLLSSAAWSYRVGMVVDLTYPSLADEQVLLRPWTEADIPQQMEAFRDPTFLTYSDWQPVSNQEASQRLNEQEQGRARGEQIDFAIVSRDDLRLVLGGASLNWVNEKDKRASLGYWLAPTARGRGVASRSVRLIARWAFETLHLARLEITCGPEDVKAVETVEV